jgi:tryptophan synthase alpha chain
VSRLADTFAAAREKNRKVLVTYLCVGDPSVDESVALALACVEAGADVLELGVPFSDPTADGPAIARASQRAIAAGGGLSATLRAAKAIRARSAVPIVLFGYYNPLFVRGEARAADDAADAGVDALLVVDLPLEEGAELREHAASRGLAVVPLLAPTSTDARASAVAALGERAGFVYYVSITGVTGSGAVQASEAAAAAAKLRQKTGLPVVVGFGIDAPDKARVVAHGTPIAGDSAIDGADGVVVGTAIVREIEASATAAERTSRVTALVRSLRTGLDS